MLENINGTTHAAIQSPGKPLALFDLKKDATSYAEKELASGQLYHVKEVLEVIPLPEKKKVIPRKKEVLQE